jgi:hypothetical protein
MRNRLMLIRVEYSVWRGGVGAVRQHSRMLGC